MTFDAVRTSVESNLNPVDFVEGLYDGAIKQPARAFKQLVGCKPADESGQDRSSMAKNAGNLVGFIIDFGILSRLTDGVLEPILGTGSASAAGAATRMAVAGAIYGGVFKPSANNDHLLKNRLEAAAVDGATFAVMGAANKVLGDLPVFANKNRFDPFAKQTLLQRVETNAIAGALGGTVNTLGSTYVADHRLATAKELTTGAGEYAAFGAGFGALGFGLDKSFDSAGKKIPLVEEFRSNYYFATKDIHENLRRRGYQLLNLTRLTHPLRDLGDMVYGSEPIIDRPHPPVTRENNPIPKFEAELQNYFQETKETTEKLKDVPQKDWEARQAIWDTQKEIAQNFAHTLVRLWNGSAEEPSLRFYTDQELSTDSISVERVAAIRHALSLTARNGHLITALSKVAGLDISDDLHGTPPNANYHTWDLSSNEINVAKQAYFKYDYYDVTKRLALPQTHHSADRAYATPIDWLAHVENEQMPGYFHGTGSQALSTLFRERELMPSKELRIKGIEQVSGESVLHERGRKQISLSRNYSVGWSYANLSSDYVHGYPTMLGVSGEAAESAQTAGLLEPGELLIDKLRLGSSLLGRFARKEITHIHVPDSEVSEVQARLDAARIRGISVFGFNQLNTPQWNDIPPNLY